MQIILVILCLGLVVWVGPANAEQSRRTFSLTVGFHKKVDRHYEIDKIFEAASSVLEQCNVVIKREGDIGTFSAPNDKGEVGGARERDAVHRVNFDIKVVKDMTFCRGEQLLGLSGCSWDPLPNKLPETPQRRSIIVTELPEDLKVAGRVLAHEFGHFTGLPHRDQPNALMVTCAVGKPENVQINNMECGCFRGGRASCNLPDSGPPNCDILGGPRRN
jgi:hypothetical protein